VRGKQWLGRSAAVAAVLLAAIQFVPVSRTNPPVAADVSAPPAVASILRRACYDCHSNETRWPWYSRVAPISWWLAEHVKEGRGDMNFSEWPVLDFEEQDLLFGDITKQVKKDKMPPASYRLGHPEARLNEQERAALLEWAAPGE
jgi:hypothetical protein